MTDNVLNRTPREETINAIQEMVARYIMGRTGIDDLREQSIFVGDDDDAGDTFFEFISGTGFGERAFTFRISDAAIDYLAECLEDTL